MNLDVKSHIRGLRYDLPSGLVVFLVAIPLCLGIALTSGVPLLSGFIAGIAGGIVVTLLSKSSLSVSGPAAGLISLVTAYIASLGSIEAFFLAVALAGLIQIALGLLRLGSVALFVPSSVILGMLAAIGLTLILKQVPHALGYDEDFEGEMQFFQPDGKNTFSELFHALTHVSVAAMLIALVSLGILIIWDRVKALKKIIWLPGPLVVVLVGTGMNEIFLASGSEIALGPMHLVALPVFDSPQAIASEFRFPDFSMILDPHVWVAALAIGIVASLETLLSVEAIDKMDPWRRRTPLNRELVAQGAGNLTSGLLGGLPITAVIVRSSVNLNSGGRTRKAAFIHGVFLLLAVLFLGRFLNHIPLSCLAAILLMTGFKLAKPKLWISMYKQGWNKFIPFATTIVAVLLTDLLEGILIGIVVGVFFVLRSNFKSAFSVAKKENSYLVRFNKDVSFLNKATLVEVLTRIPPDSSVIFNGAKAEFIDADLIELMQDFRESAKQKNTRVDFEGFDAVTAHKLKFESSTGSSH